MPILFWILAQVGLIFALCSIKAIREFSVFNWNPFVSVQFFLCMAVLVLLIHTGRRFLQKYLPYADMLAILNLLFFAFLFSTPVHIFLFTGYFYLVHLFAVRSRWKYTHGTALLLTLVPLLVSRSTKEIQFIGLSYITFRAFHLIVERERIALPRLRDYFVFLTFFPAVMAGPIDRFPRFKTDLEKGYSQINASNFSLGLGFVIFGLCQKYVFAELVSRYLLNPGASGFWPRFGDMYSYSLFLYFDFAGYSAMAIGLGYMLGVLLPQNFDKPFLSHNPQDFWKRFHITLGEWLKDYFFLPLYKAFHSVAALKNWPLLKQNLALFLTFLLMGYWNGSQRHYLLCGTLFGLYSVVHNSYVYRVKRKQFPDLFTPFGFLGKIAAISLTVTVACFALYVFSGRLPI